MTTQTNREKAIAVLQGIQSGDSSPLKDHIDPENYVQHNSQFPDGAAAIIGAIESGALQGTTVTTYRTIADGDYVALQSEYGGTWNGGDAQVIIDVFRFSEGLIVEHWDNAVPLAPKPNPSGHKQVDGYNLRAELDKTDSNRDLARGYISTILVEGQFDKIPDFVEGDDYIQHHPDIADGVSGLNAALQEFAKQGIQMEYDTIHQSHAEGNFALVVSEGKFGGSPFAFFDLLRVANGRVAEHWGIMAPIPADDEWKNDNGKF